MAREIPLGRRGALGVAVVDDTDYELVSRFTWGLSSKGYPYRATGGGAKQPLTKFIFGGTSRHVQFRNGDRLDHRRANLFIRIGEIRVPNFCRVSFSKPRLPKPRRPKKPAMVLQKGLRSRYKGVVWHLTSQRWHARIYLCGERVHLGSFVTEVEAGRVARAARRKFRGRRPSRADLDSDRSRRAATQKEKARERGTKRYHRLKTLGLVTSPDAAILRARNAAWRARHPGYQSAYKRLRKSPVEWDAWKAANLLSTPRSPLQIKSSSSGTAAPKKIRSHAARARAMGCPVTGSRTEYKEFVTGMRSAERVKCYWCQQPVPKSKRSLDHIIPLDRGGADDVANLCCSCKSCNSSKGAKLPEEFTGQYLLFHRSSVPERPVAA